MRIDLHTHTRASDGTQTAEELVRAAGAAGLDVLGLTDHDTTEGWAEAARTAEEVGITLVRGIEISTKHLGRGAHLLAYLPDPTYPPLVSPAAQDPRRPEQPGAGDAGAAALGRGRRRHRRRTPRLRRHGRDGASPRRGRAGDPGRGARPEHGVPALPQPGPAGLRQPLRRPAGRDGPHRRRGRGSGGARASLGPARPGLDAGRAPSPSSPGSGWPGSRSTTRTTRPPTGSGCAPSPGGSTWW